MEISPKKKRLVIIGISTTAEHVYEFVKEYDLYDVIGFAVDKEYKKDDTYLGLPLYDIESLPQIMDIHEDFLFVAMLWNRLNADRRKVYQKLKQQGYQFANLISPTARVRGEIGDNCWFHDYSIVQYDAHIGSNVMAMAFSLIGAKSIVESHCFVGAKATISGECTVGEQSFIGINSTVFDDRKVGKKCIVGACSAVKRDLPDCSVCKTSLDSMIVKSYDEAIIEDKLQFKLNQH